MLFRSPGAGRLRQAGPQRFDFVRPAQSLDQIAEAKAAGAALVLVDNMTPQEVAQAVGIAGGAFPIEVSGRVTLDTVAAYAAAGADLISIGVLTHSAPVLDIALDLE